MLVQRLFLVIVLGLFFLPDLAPGKEASSGEYYSFYGDVLAVDPHSITIKSGGKSLVFQITEETRISGRNRTVSLDQMKPGGSATVMMRLGQHNAGIAVRIRFDTEANVSKSLKLYAARTTSGKVVSGMAINNYIAYRPSDDGWMGGATLERAYSEGVFVLQVRPDGTVSEVKMVKSMGYNELNVHAIRWFKQWRFQPNSVTEVQMPISYLQSRYPR